MHDFVDRYQRDGYLSPIRIISETEALGYRQQLEAVEAEMGSMHYQFKAHTVMRAPYKLATNPGLLDVVAQLIGPNILLYSTSFIIKEPRSPSHVSWHQDLTYWGLSSDAQVSAWIALSPATAQSGCMQMIPGSHTQGKIDHIIGHDDHNVLLSNQRIEGVDPSRAELLPLQPGEASLHHGWTVHASTPNRSDDRRIGLNVQYIATSVKQLKAERDTALLVRGKDRFGHFEPDTPAATSFDRQAWDHQQALRQKLVAIQGST